MLVIYLFLLIKILLYKVPNARIIILSDTCNKIKETSLEKLKKAKLENEQKETELHDVTIQNAWKAVEFEASMTVKRFMNELSSCMSDSIFDFISLSM